MKSIRDASVHDKRIFLRVDFNVPMKDGRITDISRIEKSTPTIKYLIDRKAKIILGTHLGRPKGKFNSDFSTIPLAKELAKILGKEVFATDQIISPEVTAKANSLPSGGVLMLGNLRFDPREEENNKSFAQELANLADIYVNDAFAVSHRDNTSVSAITACLPSFSGLLLESEITTLRLLLQNPIKPFLVIIGGAKVKDKAGLIDNLAVMADGVLLGGAIAITFSAAKGEDIGDSLVEPEMFPVCAKMLEKFKQKIILPSDYTKVQKADGSFQILDIGQNTIDKFTHEISYASTIFWNGNLGYTEDEKFRNGTLMVAKAIADSGKTTVVAGGDTVGFLAENKLAEKMSFVSTGGGATMEFLAGKTLPGLEALEKNNSNF